MATGCVNVFSQKFGDVLTTKPNFVLDVFRQGAKVGQPIILFQRSNSDPAEDFTVSFQGMVSDFDAAGLVSPRWPCTTATAAPRPTTSPRSSSSTRRTAWTAACAWVSRSTADPARGVTLQPCGVSAKTVWIMDTFDTSSVPALHVPVTSR